MCNVCFLCFYHYLCIVPSAPVCPDDVIKGTDLAGTPVSVSWTYPEANNMTNVFPLVSSHANGTTFAVGKKIVNISLENFSSLYCNFSVTVFIGMIYDSINKVFFILMTVVLYSLFLFHFLIDVLVLRKNYRLLTFL